MNTDARNFEKYLELCNYFKENGFFKYPNFNIYSARLRDYSHLTEAEHKGLDFVSLQTFTTKQISLGINTFQQGKYKSLYNALKNRRPIPFNSICCTSQSGGYVLDPIGNIYPCWEVIGKKEFVKATYSKKGIIWDQKVLDKWQNSDINQREPCCHCKYALICGGGCPYHNFIDKHKTQCSNFKGIFNQIINKAYAELYSINH